MPRARCAPAPRISSAPDDAIETVGTGGDNVGTYNISTASALVVAACGVTVAKHGNRAFSSRSGSADVLSALGVNLDCDFRLIERAIAEAKVGFMMAPRHHSAMRHVAGTRVELGTRTIFNLLGPLSNPAGVRRQLVGVFDRKWLEPMARTFGNLGSVHSWVVHGSDGLDEITTTGPTHVCEFKGGQVRSFDVAPEDAGIKRAKLDELRGGTPQENAAALRSILAGRARAVPRHRAPQCRCSPDHRRPRHQPARRRGPGGGRARQRPGQGDPRKTGRHHQRAATAAAGRGGLTDVGKRRPRPDLRRQTRGGRAA